MYMVLFFKPHEATLRYFEKQSEKLGYSITHKVINCAIMEFHRLDKDLYVFGFRKI